MLTSVLLAVVVTVGAPVAVVGWLWVVERLLGGVPRQRRRTLRAWLWLLFPVTAAGVFLLWPLLQTAWLSINVTSPARGTHLGGANFRFLWDSAEVHSALRNNALWLVGLTAGSLVIGTAVALLANVVRWEPFAKAVVVMPTAISAVAGAVIWRFAYDYRPPGFPQTGTLNAIWVGVTGRGPVAWLVDGATNNAALIAVGIWMSVGLVTVVLSAAVKSIPDELIEAGRLDGAGPVALFRYVVLPQLLPTIVVVGTLLAITSLKAFDVVYVMTNGNYDTNVLANMMYRELFLGSDPGRAAALAVLLVALVAPIIAVNVRFHRADRSW
jgi:alpha-glucoside transport system permease protein